MYLLGKTVYPIAESITLWCEHQEGRAGSSPHQAGPFLFTHFGAAGSWLVAWWVWEGSTRQSVGPTGLPCLPHCPVIYSIAILHCYSPDTLTLSQFPE